MSSKDILLALASGLACLLVVSLFFLILGNIFSGSESSFSWSFLLEESALGGREGGILEVIVSSSLILFLCLLLSLPISLATAVFLAVFAKKQGFLGRVINLSISTLAATPSIVFGLFGYAFFCIFLGFGFSLIAGGFTLACMILPFLIRLFQQGIASANEQHALAGASLGMSQTTLVLKVLLPRALPAISAGLVLGIARALSETAALLFTSGYVLRMPESLLDSGRTLSVHIYDLSMNVPGGNQNAYNTAIVLVVFLLLVNLLASGLSKRLLNIVN